MRVLVWVLVVAFAGWALLQLTGADPAWRWVGLVAFTPYVALASVLPLALAAVLRRWAAGAVALLTVAAMALSVLPRTFSDGNPAVRGTTLRVLSANLEVGSADARELVALVRDLKVDVLTLQELTPGAVARLDAAGLRGVLPHVVDRSAGGASGSGIYSRFPLQERPLITRGYFRQARAILDPLGVEVVSVHPCAPHMSIRATCWAPGLRALPRAGGTLTVLAGDFNATLDHWTMRELLASGYRDAADVTGRGFTATWPVRGRDWVPGVTIDHVLTDSRIAVSSYSVRSLADTDHRPVFAELRLP